MYSKMKSHFRDESTKRISHSNERTEGRKEGREEGEVIR